MGVESRQILGIYSMQCCIGICIFFFQVALAGDDPGIFYIFDYFLIMSVVIVLFDENT
jgi:hypothetical protein